MREREFKFKKEHGTRRILFIGDSFTFGTGIDAEWRFSDFTDRALNDDTEVINAGVPGWGNDQELIYFESFAQHLQPDIVVLTLTLANDLANNALDRLLEGSAPKPRCIVVSDSLVLINQIQDRPEPRTSIKSILKKSRFLVFIKRRFDKRDFNQPNKVIHAGVPPGVGRKKASSGWSHWSVFEKTYEPELESAWRVTEAILSQFSDRCRTANVDFMVFAFPLKIEVDREWRRLLLQPAEVDTTILDFHRPYQRLEAFCADNSIELLYPLETFKKAARSRRLYLEKDGHPNKYGHALAARVLLHALKDRHGLEFEIAESDLDYLP
jgi:lysophospholipase L1-like esterase